MLHCSDVRLIVLEIILTLNLVPVQFASGLTYDDESNFEFDLPSDHIPFFLSRRSDLRQKCLSSRHCPFEDISTQLESGQSTCFGYETNCDLTNSSSYSTKPLRCPGKSNWDSVQTKDEQRRVFWNQGDFGFLKERMEHMETICEEESNQSSVTSSLICSDHLRYCYAKNIVIDFKNLRSNEHSDKYREDVIREGNIGGKCWVNVNLLRNRADHHSPLQSWAAELKHFERFGNISWDKCDVVFEKPVILIKLDAGISMYHHFCDFVNLYASQHLNGSFHRDVHIIQWDTSGFPYNDFFVETWKAFTDLPLIHLKELDGKKVCFRQAMFPVLARMIFGLYYNMPLIGGCEGSGLIHAFSQHIIHRLRLVQTGPRPDGRLRVTFLSRSTTYRRILNEDELISGLKTMTELEVRKVDYASLLFPDQLNQTMNTDIFIGIHGSGLTHLLFLPDWAAIFEIYNCEDQNCYSDLSRLRGIGYFTWERKDKLKAEDEGHHPTLGAHAKFTNYYFNLEEFLRILARMIKFVRENEAYRNGRQRKAMEREHGGKEEL